MERLQAKAIDAALDDYQRDKSRYDTSIQRKQITHTTIVKFIYIIVLLIAFMTNAYMDAVVEYVEGENPDPEPPSGLQKLDERVPHSSNGQMDKSQPIGFHSDSSKTGARLTVPPKSLIVRDTRTVSKQGYEITCQNCGKKAIKNSPNKAKYCSPECRKEAYERRTGKELGV